MTLLDPRMTNTPSPTDEELIERHITQLKRAAIRQCGDACIQTEGWDIADRLESLLSDRAKLEEALRGIVAEFEKFSRYGSPIAMQANEAMQRARAALNRNTDRAA